MSNEADHPIERFLAGLADSDGSAAAGRSGLVHIERTPARPARFTSAHSLIPSKLRKALGVDRLWAHQGEAIEHLRAGRSVVLATGTASGKSLCYQLPILESIVVHPEPATALLLFPTKALAHDQHRSIEGFRLPGVVAGCFDGDASREERTWARTQATLLLTNPEMLHHHVLPDHPRWARFFARLRFIVIDELHVLRGVFGSHVAHLLRRIRRVAARYGAEPQFIFTSATIGRPAELASALCGLPVTSITDDGSPRPSQWFAVWNPQRDGTQRNRSSHHDVAQLIARMALDGRRTIAFTSSRKRTEIIAEAARAALDGSGRIRSYRGGYLPHERREIEDDLARGNVDAIVATSALELGIDIGGLDGCVLDGFPGTVASLWQQAGRTGRSDDDSLVVLVAGNDQLDQYFVHHPHELFSREPEPVVINPANPAVLLPHLACAAHEAPLTHADGRYWPQLLDDGVRKLVLGSQLRVRQRRAAGPIAIWSGSGVPGHGVSLRGTGGREVSIYDPTHTLVGTVDAARADSLVHQGAIYLHQGRHWLVEGLDLQRGVAQVVPHGGGEYTQPISETDIAVLEVTQTEDLGQTIRHLGTVEVTNQVRGYRRRSTETGELLETAALELPPHRLVTESFWFTVEEAVLHRIGLDEVRWPGALHATEHALIGLLPLVAICDRWDVGGVSTALAADTGRPTVFVYDGTSGGSGVSALASIHLASLFVATDQLVASCPCATGCPSCVQSPKCGNGNEPLDKEGASELLRAIVAGLSSRRFPIAAAHASDLVDPDAPTSHRHHAGGEVDAGQVSRDPKSGSKDDFYRVA